MKDFVGWATPAGVGAIPPSRDVTKSAAAGRQRGISAGEAGGGMDR
jgi:hypothetical protein